MQVWSNSTNNTFRDAKPKTAGQLQVNDFSKLQLKSPNGCKPFLKSSFQIEKLEKVNTEGSEQEQKINKSPNNDYMVSLKRQNSLKDIQKPNESNLKFKFMEKRDNVVNKNKYQFLKAFKGKYVSNKTKFHSVIDTCQQSLLMKSQKS